jgi:long-chain acyl-CoA synthetase
MTTVAEPSGSAPEGQDPFGARTVCEAFQLTAAQRAGEVAIRTRGDAVSITWAEYAERVRRLAAGLAALGLRRGDSIALMLLNRPEFHLVDAAAMHLGATSFSIYNTSSPEQIAYLLGDAGNRIVVTESAFADRIAASGVELDHLVVIDGDFDLAALEAAGDPGFDFDSAWRAVEPEDVITLIYTSGTTGPPKGVQTTHRNVMAEARCVHEAVGLSPGGSIVSFLPAAHIADRGTVHYNSLVCGWTVTDCPDPREVIAHLPDAQPKIFGAVPRVWEKLKAALEASGAAKGDAAQLRESLGLGQTELFICGAAPTPPEVLEFFASIGIPICEVWGMSETTSIATINPREAIRIGTVGPPIPGLEIELAADGEIMVRGEIVMKGYRHLPDPFTEDGWLPTGDIGEFDEAGYLKIVDRKKELIINAAGKNMSPANIEAKLKAAHPLIGQAVAIGDRRPYNVALIALDPDAAGAFAPGRSLAELAGDPSVEAALHDGLERANAQLSRVEQIKRFKVLPTEWQPGGDELTPTMKLKRRPIGEKYAAEIEELYAGARS